MKIPYGYYLNDKNEVSIDPAKADAVIMIYDMYIEGISLRKISQKLSEKGYLSPSGKKVWSAQAIDNIVCNSKYVGIVSFEKYVEAIYGDDFESYIKIENNTGINNLRYDMSVKVTCDGSDGIVNGKILAFDSMLMEIGN